MEGNGNGVYKTLCNMCATHCGIDLHVRDGIPIKVQPMPEHILNKLCVKSAALPDLQQSKERLTYPQKKTGSGWKRITWDEAIDTIVDKFQKAKEEYGPESVVLEFGHGLFNKEAIGLYRLFAESFGTPNITNAGCLCEYPKAIASFVSYGDEAWQDIGRGKLVLQWGLNSWHSQTPARSIYQNMKNNGQKLIVVDPRVTWEAKRADLYLQIRPGTDQALMLGLLNVIIGEDLYDKDYVEKYTVGFDKLADAVKEYTPQKVAEITHIPAEKIVECARMYATIKPATFATMVALEQTSNAFQNFRAYVALMAVTGNLGIEGGNRITQYPPDLLKWPYQEDDYVLKTKTFSADRLPLWERVMKEANGNFLAEAILSGEPYPIRALLIQAGNPAVTFIDSNKFKRAMEAVDFVVVHDLFMTETAKLADMVLPATTGLESRWTHSYIWAGLALIAMGKKIVEPLGECWSDAKFLLELGKRMGFTEAFPWKDTDDLIEQAILGPYGKSIKDMEEQPGGFFYAPKTTNIHMKRPFNTPSGKIELYSQMLDDMGIPPLPVPYIEPIESPVTTPELFKDFSLIGITGARTDTYEHSCWRNLPRIRGHRPDPEVEIHPNDAENAGVKNGEWVMVESPRGETKMKANVTEDIMEGVISMPHGWSGDGNCNRLTSDEVLDPIIGAALARGFACRVTGIPQ